MEIVQNTSVGRYFQFDGREELHAPATARTAVLTVMERLGLGATVRFIEFILRTFVVHAVIYPHVNVFVPIYISGQGVNLNGLLSVILL